MSQPRSRAEALDAHAHPERATIEAQAHALTAHAVAWVTAAERLGLELREEEPEATRGRVLDALGGVGERVGRELEREAIVRFVCALADRHPEGGISDIVRAGLYTLAARIERGEHVGEGR